MSEARDHHVTIRFAQGYEFMADFPDVEGAPSVRLDEPAPLGEGRGPNAAAMLAAAVGTCLAASLLFCLRKVRLEPEDLTADVVAHVGRNESGRFRITGIDVTLSPALLEMDRGRFDRCEKLFEDYCVVTESVRRGIPVNVKVVEPAGTFPLHR
jgi:organic hydroperoxide reductase OsmC/OhrA